MHLNPTTALISVIKRVDLHETTKGLTISGVHASVLGVCAFCNRDLTGTSIVKGWAVVL